MTPELRKDSIVDRWVMIAPERAHRPMQLQHDEADIDDEFDPFAEGHEAEAPAEILAIRPVGSPANGPGWRVRVVPNKFPAVHREAMVDDQHDGLFQMSGGYGAHEVIIECPHNEANMSRLTAEDVSDVLWVYQQRLADLQQDERLAHALIFKNKGLLAGASLQHAHSQLIASPLVPLALQEKLDGARDYFQRHGRSIFADLIERELQAACRVVIETPGFLAFCPYASRFPFETWILPKRPTSHFHEVSRADTDELATVLKTVLLRLEITLNDPAYNYVLHTAPFRQPSLPHFSWHFEILPRLSRIAGFELGSGYFINPVFPETAAKILRDCHV